MAENYYEKGFKPRVPVDGIEYKGEEKPGYLEDHNTSPDFKKVPFEAEGAGSSGPAAR